MIDPIRRSHLRKGQSRPPLQRWHRPRFETLESRFLLSITAGVVGHHVFYDNSIFDETTPGVNVADDNAIDTSKSAYLAGTGTATTDSLTSYSRGINGIMVDIAGSHGIITPADFTFKVGTSNDPGTWAPAPPPSAVSVRPGAGDASSDRVEITWDDNEIQNTWLEVIVAAGDNTGLAKSDVFYFGNLIGDTFSDALSTFVLVDASDEIEARNNQGIASSPNNSYDFNKDFSVDASDQIIARNNGAFMARADLSIVLPALSAQLTVDTGPDSTPNSDGITSDPSVQGTLTAATSIVSFKAGLNSDPVTTDALGQISGSAFALDQAFLETLNGGPLADGVYVVHLQAVDSDGYSAAAEVAFTLKTSMTSPTLPDLIAADDSGTSSTDDITKITTPRIDITAETGSLVRIYVDGSPVDTATGAPGLQFTLAALSDGLHNIHVVAQDGAGNSATSPTLPITVSTVLPTVSATTIATISADLTPHVTVSASGPVGLANGEQVILDVDLDYDGNFAGAGEVARTTSTLYNGGSYFQLTPALPHDIAGAAYNVQLRVRVTDIAGNEGTSPPISLKIDSIGTTDLLDYVSSDPLRPYTANKFGGGAPVGAGSYYVNLVSGTWRSLADVKNPLWPSIDPEWRHWMQVIIPTGTISHSALLFIDGGDNSLSAPGGPDSTAVAAANALHSVVVLLPTVPNQPLQFIGEGFNRSEDAIISYSFDKYAAGGAGSETWPVLFAMAQSAISAMDVTQQLVPAALSGWTIDDFVVTGYSKRGWTTWLTAASDDRVRAIIPGVIDVLNMGEQMVHHYSYGYSGPGSTEGFSSALNDYVGFDIPQDSYTVGGQKIGRAVDPYSYLDNGRFDDLPKLIINSTGDQFFVPDSSQFYFSDLPGTQNYLRYIPNTGHSLNSIDPYISTLTFFDAVVNGSPLPQYSWTVEQNGDIVVQSTTTPTAVKVWRADSPNHDFRYDTGVTWFDTSGTDLTDLGGGTYVASVPTPVSGASGYLVELTYPSGVAGVSFIFTTQIHIATNIAPVPWDFYMPTIPPPAPPPSATASVGPLEVARVSDDDANVYFNAVAAAIAAPVAEATAEANWQSPPVASAPATPRATTADVDKALASNWSWADDDGDESPTEDDDELALMLLGDDRQ